MSSNEIGMVIAVVAGFAVISVVFGCLMAGYVAIVEWLMRWHFGVELPEPPYIFYKPKKPLDENANFYKKTSRLMKEAAAVTMLQVYFMVGNLILVGLGFLIAFTLR
jgi:hypothetical protein